MNALENILINGNRSPMAYVRTSLYDEFVQAFAMDANKREWITVKGTHVKVGEHGLEGEIGKKIEESVLQGEEGRKIEEASQPSLSKRERRHAHAAKTISEFYGPEIKGKNLKGVRAIECLLRERKGHIKAAFHRDDIGDIDLCWGDTEAGLVHIVNHRIKNKQDWRDVMRNLSNVIDFGKLEKDRERKDSYAIRLNDIRVIISKSFKGASNRLVLSGYQVDR